MSTSPHAAAARSAALGCWRRCVLLALGMPLLKPLFAALFPALDRPLYEQDSFAALLGSHVAIVAARARCR